MTNHRGRVIGVAKVYQHTVELRSSLLVRDAGHGFEQRVYVVLVRGVFACKAGRANTGLASEGINGQSAIVCQGGQSGCPGCVPGFENRVLDKCNGGFPDLIHPKLSLGNRGYAQGRQPPGQFGNFAFVVAGDNELFGHNGLYR